MKNHISRTWVVSSMAALGLFFAGCGIESTREVDAPAGAAPETEAVAPADTPDALPPTAGTLETMGREADETIAAAGEAIDGAVDTAVAAGAELSDEVKAGAAVAAEELKEAGAEAKVALEGAATEVQKATADARAAISEAAAVLSNQADEKLKQAGVALTAAAAAAKASGLELGDDIEAQAEAIIKELKSSSADASDALATKAAELSKTLREEADK